MWTVAGVLGPGARRRIVAHVRAGMSQKAAAARSCVSPATVNRWVRRERQASAAARASGAWALDRSSRPASLPEAAQVRQTMTASARVRERTGWGPRLIAGVVGLPHSTVHAGA